MPHPLLSANSARRLLTASVLLLSLAGVALSAQAPKKAAPAKAAPAAKPAAAKAPAAAGASHGASTTTAAHGPTTAAHGPTTAGATHGPTTGGPSTAGHGPVTAASHGPAAPGGRPGAPGAPGGAAHGGFGGRPTPAGAHETRTPGGAMVRTRANGSRSDFHDDRRGMDVHHNLDGNRRVMVVRGAHSRVFAERGGRGYVQHPYMYHGREFGHRTYYDHGRAYDRYYNRYGYRGGYLDVYAPNRYYGPGFYGWAYNPWRAPIAYSWGWGGAPWYGYYGGYYAPYAVYPSAAFWLTDYLISTSLQAAYLAQQDPGPPPPPGTVGMTPEVKAMIAAEVQRQVALENSEATANAAQQDIDPAGSSIARMLSDGNAHVFVVGADLDLVGADGAECPVSQGDVLQVSAAPPPDATAVNALVLTSKGWRKECRASGEVSVAFSDLQDMQNHMRETIDAGMGDLQAKQGSGGLPAAPPSARAAPVPATFAASAPPPDPNAATEITQQAQAADQAEQQEASGAAPPPPGAETAGPPPPPPGPAPTVALGQSFDEVTAAMGAPTRIIDLGAKKIYVYNGLKVTFKGGKVSDVE